MIIAELTGTGYLVFYVVRFVIMAAVIVAAIALGAFLRKKYDSKKAQKAASSANVEILTASNEEDVE